MWVCKKPQIIKWLGWRVRNCWKHSFEGLDLSWGLLFYYFIMFTLFFPQLPHYYIAVVLMLSFLVYFSKIAGKVKIPCEIGTLNMTKIWMGEYIMWGRKPVEAIVVCCGTQHTVANGLMEPWCAAHCNIEVLCTLYFYIINKRTCKTTHTHKILDHYPIFLSPSLVLSIVFFFLRMIGYAPREMLL